VRRAYALALTLFFFAVVAAGQQSVPSASSSANAQPAPAIVQLGDSGVTPPNIVMPVAKFSASWHCNRLDGTVSLSTVVGTDGVPRQIKLMQSDAPRLNDFAIRFAGSQRFKPGTFNGQPAAVAVQMILGLQTCLRESRKGGNGGAAEVKLRAYPSIAIGTLASQSIVRNSGAKSGNVEGPYKVGGKISPPVLLSFVQPKYSRYGRRKKLTGTCVIGLIVDANGNPQNVHVVKGLEPSMDANAVAAIMQERFKPAMEDGTLPVPVEIEVQVNFRLR
jgi:TonB family protein